MSAVGFKPPPAAECDARCFALQVQRVLAVNGEAPFSSATVSAEVCSSEVHAPSALPLVETLRTKWTSVRNCIAQYEREEVHAPSHGHKFHHWLVTEWAESNGENWQRLLLICKRTQSNRKKADNPSHDAVPRSSTPDSRPADMEQEQKHAVGPFRTGKASKPLLQSQVKLSVREGVDDLPAWLQDDVHDFDFWSDQALEGFACDGGHCGPARSPYEYRMHCVKCASELRMYNLCFVCYQYYLHLSRNAWPRRQDGHCYDHLDSFTPVYNRHRKSPARDGERMKRQLELLDRLPLKHATYNAADQSTTRICQRPLSLMCELASRVNNVGEVMSCHRWRALQWMLEPNRIDLSFFYHKARQYEWLLFLFWGASNIFDDGQKLAKLFMADTRIHHIPRSWALCHHLRTVIKKNSDKDVDVRHFSFDYLTELTCAMSGLCALFRRPVFQPAFDLLTSTERLPFCVLAQLNNHVMQLVDQQPDFHLDAIICRAYDKLGEEAAKLDPATKVANVTEFVDQAVLILQHFERTCAWRVCRLKLATLSHELLEFVSERCLRESGSQPKRADIDQLQSLSHFLQRLCLDLRPTEAVSMFENDEEEVERALSDSDCQQQLLYLVHLLVNERGSISYTESAAALLSRLVTLYIFVLQAFKPEDVSRAIAQLQAPAEKGALLDIATAVSHWSINAPQPGEILSVLGGQDSYADIGRWLAREMPYAFVSPMATIRRSSLAAQTALTTISQPSQPVAEQHSAPTVVSVSNKEHKRRRSSSPDERERNRLFVREHGSDSGQERTHPFAATAQTWVDSCLNSEAESISHVTDRVDGPLSNDSCGNSSNISPPAFMLETLGLNAEQGAFPTFLLSPPSLFSISGSGDSPSSTCAATSSNASSKAGFFRTESGDQRAYLAAELGDPLLLVSPVMPRADSLGVLLGWPSTMSSYNITGLG